MPRDGFPTLIEDNELGRLIDEVSLITGMTTPAVQADTVPALVRLSLPHINPPVCCDTPVNGRGYARRVIYTDPAGRFSALIIRWKAGAETPIHGHHAWGAVGVLEGELVCETFAKGANGQPLPTGKVTVGKGKIAAVKPDPEGIHRLSNPFKNDAVTLHIYGMDLSENPCAINVPYER